MPVAFQLRINDAEMSPSTSKRSTSARRAESCQERVKASTRFTFIAPPSIGLPSRGLTGRMIHDRGCTLCTGSAQDWEPGGSALVVAQPAGDFRPKKL